MDARTYNNDKIEQAILAAKQSTPKVLTIVDHPNQQLNICVFGCQGGKIQFDDQHNPIIPSDYAPIEVAKLLNDIIAKEPERKPDLIILLGDNFYPDGVFSPVDPRFQAQFYDIYSNPEFKHIADIPCAVVLGNHDGGRDTESHLKKALPFNGYLLGTNPHSNEDAELLQIAHSYLMQPQDLDQSTSKEELFEQKHISYSKLPKHIMPHFFYSLIFDKVQIFGLNSNTYAKDFLHFMQEYAAGNTIDPQTNQAAWLKQEYEAAIKADRATVFAMHHPLFTTGKRAYPSGWDAKHYLNPNEITLLNQILALSPQSPDYNDTLKNLLNKPIDAHVKLDSNANYNEMLTKIICVFQGMSPSMICTAHDHSIYYYNNKHDNRAGPKLCQVVSGGGGSEELQARSYFGQHKNLGCFMREHGLALLSCDKTKPSQFNINIHTTNSLHLAFDSNGPVPHRSDEIDSRIKVIRDIVLDACISHVMLLDRKQTLANGKLFPSFPYTMNISRLFQTSQTYNVPDVDKMHEIMNFLNQPTLASYEETITFLFEKMSALTNKESAFNIYKDINLRLQIKLRKTIEELHDELPKNENLDFSFQHVI